MKTYIGSDHAQAKIEGMNTYNFSAEGYLYFDDTGQVGNDDAYQVYLVDPASLDGWYVDFYDEDGTVSGKYMSPAQAVGQDLSLGANLMLNKAWVSTNDAPTYGFGPGQGEKGHLPHPRNWPGVERCRMGLPRRNPLDVCRSKRSLFSRHCTKQGNCQPSHYPVQIVVWTSFDVVG